MPASSDLVRLRVALDVFDQAAASVVEDMDMLTASIALAREAGKPIRNAELPDVRLLQDRCAELQDVLAGIAAGSE
jgi:hypothetical protein